MLQVPVLKDEAKVPRAPETKERLRGGILEEHVN